MCAAGIDHVQRLTSVFKFIVTGSLPGRNSFFLKCLSVGKY